jgi:ABC-type molybdate transport system substrate-binding protein
MKNVKFIKSALIVGSLVIASSTFADTPSTISSAGITTGAASHLSSSTLTNGNSKSHLTAFAGVPTAAVSPVELNTVSGDGKIRDFINKVIAIWKKPSCYVKC